MADQRPFPRLRVIAVSLFALATAPACAQDISTREGTVQMAQVTGAIPVAAPAGSPGRPTGAVPRVSHPLMEPAALEHARANFATCIEGLWPSAREKGVTRATFDRHARSIDPDMSIMTLMETQPEFSRQIWDYLEGMASQSRISRGREILERHKATFDDMERRFGVDRFLLASIWGIESSYGTGIGGRSVLRSTATLACIGRRQEFFRGEFIATLQILQRGDVPAEHLRGSWAGAFGHTQFMPTGYLIHAVDGDGDGKANLVDSVADVLASTATRFRNEGWIQGASWGYEVSTPRGFDFLLADPAKEMTLAEWERLGVRRVGGQGFTRPSDRAFLMVPAGANGPKFLMLHNFKMIMKYNPAEAYALAVGHFADRLRGGGPIVQAWPRGERALSRDERLELQSLLLARGFDIGVPAPTGRLGARTRAAVRDFQARSGMVPDGFITVSVLERLRR